jgi:putative NADPH-quinone reductase
MKILAINGSHRGNKGYNHFLINKLLQGAAPAGADCELITLAELKINRCLSCGQCHTEGHYLQCVHNGKDDTQAIFHKMAEANIIIYATPVYVFGMSGLLKTFLDRMYATGDVFDLKLSKSGLLFHHIDHAICSKPFVVQVCCDNLETETPKNVLGYFQTFSRFMDAPQLGVLVRNGGRLSGYGSDPEREKWFPIIQDVYAAYEQAGYELATEGRIRSTTQRQASQEIVPVPFFHLLKRLRFKPLKTKFLERARELFDN